MSHTDGTLSAMRPKVVGKHSLRMVDKMEKMDKMDYTEHGIYGIDYLLRGAVYFLRIVYH
jgi:hypothetical protein